MAAFASVLLWSSLELVISIGFIAAYAHILCFATSLVLRDEQSLEHSTDPDLPKKEQTAAFMLTGLLVGVHIMTIFFGLELLGLKDDSFLMNVIMSCAIIAAGTTGLVFGGMMLWLIVPAFYSCARSFTRRIRGGSRKSVDVESAASTNDAEAKQAFLETIDEKE